MKHIMLDLETMGTKPGSAITQIGAVDFDLEGNMGGGFSVNISLRGNADCGLTFDPDTIGWWLDDDRAEARRSVFKGPSHDLKRGLQMFSKYVKDVKGQFMWGNGATFDNVLLTCAYDKVPTDRPWHFRDDRDMRTVVSLVKMMGIDVPWTRVGVAHVALDDAKTQALYVQRALKGMRERI